ncbi:hypothetical protein N8Y78_00250 [Ascidiaceihabitans sp.]|nr:hypothetical protein [Ascidiaceihabitans sp.]
MATSFDVISLGDPGIQIDHVEGNSTAENASALVGQTFGTVLDPLYRNTQTFAPEGSPGSSYSANNSAANEQFSIDGTVFTFDAIVVYTALVTFADGTTATLDLDIVQATSGEMFIVPFTTGQEASQAILEQGPVQSISLTAAVNSGGDLNADRLASDFPDPVDGYDRDDTIRNWRF